MAFRCPDSKVVTTGMISDYELQFRQVATIEPKEGSEVPVLIWELGGQDELSLDRYEGFPHLYRKERYRGGNKRRKAKMYGICYERQRNIIANSRIL